MRLFFLLWVFLIVTIGHTFSAQGALTCEELLKTTKTEYVEDFDDYPDPLLGDWTIYSREYQITTQRNIENTFENYRKGFVENRPYVSFLLEAGFRLFKNDIHVPTLEQLLVTYYHRMEQAVRHGIIHKEDILRPARVFRTSSSYGSYGSRRIGKVVPVEYGGKVEHGLVPVNGLLSAEDFYSIIAQGYYPIGENYNNLFDAKINTTALHHDFVHLAIFADHPKVMVYLRAEAKKIKYASNDQLNEFSPVFHILEALSTTSRSYVKKLFRSLNIQPQGQFLTITEADQIVAGMSDQQIKGTIDFLILTLDKNSQYWGGTSADLLTIPFHRKDLFPGAQWTRQPYGLVQRLKDLYYEPKRLKYRMEDPSIKTFVENQIRANLADMLVTLDGFSQLTVEDWYASLDGTTIAVGSPADLFFRQSEIASKRDDWLGFIQP